MDQTRSGNRCRWLLGAVAVLIAACAPSKRVDLDPRTAPADAYVVGRVEVFRDGKKLRVTHSEFGHFARRSELTELSLMNLATKERFAVAITDADGWFAAALPPGTYSVGMRYHIWLFGTPARIVVLTDVQHCYLGTLDISLFVHLSVAGGWAEVTGGAIPQQDNDYRVFDQSREATRYAGEQLPMCLLTLNATPDQ